MAASQVRYGKEWASVCTANTFTQRITYCTRWQRWRLQYPRWRVIYVEKRKRGAVDIISSDWNGGNGRKNIRNWINSNPSRIAMGAGIWGKELWYVALETNKIAVNNLLLFFLLDLRSQPLYCFACETQCTSSARCWETMKQVFVQIFGTINTCCRWIDYDVFVT